MATASQLNANRENAKASTGPKTEEGKAKSARNNTKFGLESPLRGESLFATDNRVQPEEKEDYGNFSTALWPPLAPADPVEEVTAAEFVRNAWRLRRQRAKKPSHPPFCKSNPIPPRPQPKSRNPKRPPQQFEPNLSLFPSPSPSLASANPSTPPPSETHWTLRRQPGGIFCEISGVGRRVRRRTACLHAQYHGSVNVPGNATISSISSSVSAGLWGCFSRICAGASNRPASAMVSRPSAQHA